MKKEETEIVIVTDIVIEIGTVKGLGNVEIETTKIGIDTIVNIVMMIFGMVITREIQIGMIAEKNLTVEAHQSTTIVNTIPKNQTILRSAQELHRTHHRRLKHIFHNNCNTQIMCMVDFIITNSKKIPLLVFILAHRIPRHHHHRLLSQ